MIAAGTSVNASGRDASAAAGGFAATRRQPSQPPATSSAHAAGSAR